MRLAKKMQFIRNCNRLQDGQKRLEKYAKEHFEKENTGKVCYEVLVELQERAIDLGSGLEEEGLRDTVAKLEVYCEQIYECSLVVEKQEELLENCGKLWKLYQEIDTEVTAIPVKVKIAFFPYKISMWDSLESIWEAANQDVNCECQVVPIPYYTKNSLGEVEKAHYEGKRFALNVPVLDYRTYFLDQEQPDIMYIHNPYDQYNKVTMVEPRFFSAKLKKSGGILVYVPYYISGYGTDCKGRIAYCSNIGEVNSDYIIMQCENLKKAYAFCGFPEKRLLSLGNPKVDAVLKIPQKRYDMEEKWEPVLKDKKVILWNTSIASCIRDGQWLGSMTEWMQTILNKEEFALIWRPHPLLWDTIRERGKEKEQYEILWDTIQNAPNAIIDDSDNAEAAMKVSDAMVSDYSSLIMQYTFTGKPSYVLSGESCCRQYQVYCDYFSNYFREDGCRLEDFLDMVASGQDDRKEERIAYAKNSMVNTDGTCGQKIHQSIYKKALEKFS